MMPGRLGLGVRRTRWSVVLSVLGVGWLVATSITAFGMYMIACHANFPPHGSVTKTTSRQGSEITQEKTSGRTEHAQWGGCEGGWTLEEGHVVLVVGSLLNMVLLVTMLVLLVHERRVLIIAKDPPPDYESLIKAETPPPTFADLHLNDSFTVACTPTHHSPPTQVSTHDPGSIHVSIDDLVPTYISTHDPAPTYIPTHDLAPIHDPVPTSFPAHPPPMVPVYPAPS
nr:uncharacterized protein LOC123764368 [Procambarus clarkii]XP_045608021.1 uncharacterized protein LOC123764368 [Procambarus clarkii]XP_045608022.1 uncharacterized protein LOC123764368 [Procambarus clarkii]XP_045608023.1 uncharacterized protein LOC123764368 [Procambarus clarkii]